ncbi:MFS transporter [Aliisedimentitalea scapharcae]|uniref:MFS transporter n=1 Tax=Aliisedimentitalea scapharcae TaxID=1524259 RepID=A0ABZ2XR44_9RHOB
MLSILANRTYRHLFLAQLIAVIGTGLATIALSLLAYDLAGEEAGLVLGLALTIKMVCYVTIAPIAAAFAAQMPRRTWLVTLDLIRAGAALCLPFVTEIWQIYLLIFVLQSASAAFTPAYQASIPDVLPDEEEYTKALSLSRLAYDLESLVSPGLAALLLGVLTFDSLFFGTAIGFVASALLVTSILLPSPVPTVRRSLHDRTTRGLRLYLTTPRLRGLLGLTVAASATASMVFVNTVVMTRSVLGLGESSVALALALFGVGSMLVALILPPLLKHTKERRVMSLGALVAILSLTGLAVVQGGGSLTMGWVGLAWFGTGVGYAAVMTPSGRLLRRSVAPEDGPAIFAAQFTLSHACWLVSYPLAGWAMTRLGAQPTLLLLTGLAWIGLLVGRWAWPAPKPDQTQPETN